MLTIVGGGRIGTALADLARANELDHQIIGREPSEAMGASGAGPIVVCTRNDQLAEVITRCERPDDLCFLQNGALRPWLAEQGLAGCTQGLLYFAVPTQGAVPEPGGESVFFGRHAYALVYLLRRGNLPARILESEAELGAEIGYKLLWASIFGLLGDLHQETVLASVARKSEIATLVHELAPVCAAGLGFPLSATVSTQRLLDYSRAIGSWRASVKEWSWRNGWLIETARRFSLPIPAHDALVKRWIQAGGVY